MNAVSELIRQSHVRDLGLLPAPRLAPNATAHQGLQFLVRGRRGAIVIVEGLTPTGIFTERDIVNRLPAELYTSRDLCRRTPMKEIMSQPPATIRRQARLSEAIETMVERGYRQLVVVDGAGQLKGLLTAKDIVQFLTDHFPEDTINLPPRLRQQYRRPGGA